MPEIRDLDRALEALLDEVDVPSRTGGAAAAIRQSRRRRTALAGVAAAALVVAGGITASQVLTDGAGNNVAPAGTPSLPVPAPFDPDALNSAAPGWTADDWFTPTEMDLAVLDTPDALWRCLDAHDPSGAGSDPEPHRSGRHLMATPAGELTTTTFGDFTGQPDQYATARAEMDDVLSACAQGSVTTNDYADGGAMTTYVLGSAEEKVQSAWLGHVGHRLVMMLSVTDAAPSVAERTAVGEALLAGVQDDATFNDDGDVNQGEAQASEADTGLTALTSREVQEALGASFNLSAATGSVSYPDAMPCADTSELPSDSSAGASLGAQSAQEVLSYSSNEEALGAWGTLVDQLEACDGTRWVMTTHTATSLAWESGVGTLWMDVVGRRLVVLTIPGAVGLPAEVKLAVARLLA